MTYSIPILAVLAVLAVPATASAAAPHRTVEQAQNQLEKRLGDGWSSLQCLGDKTDRPGTALYRTFVCLAGLRAADDFTDMGASAYRLTARRHGRWQLRTWR